MRCAPDRLLTLYQFQAVLVHRLARLPRPCRHRTASTDRVPWSKWQDFRRDGAGRRWLQPCAHTVGGRIVRAAKRPVPARRQARWYRLARVPRAAATRCSVAALNRVRTPQSLRCCSGTCVITARDHTVWRSASTCRRCADRVTANARSAAVHVDDRWNALRRRPRFDRKPDWIAARTRAALEQVLSCRCGVREKRACSRAYVVYWYGHRP
jgi:hypothetical protein